MSKHPIAGSDKSQPEGAQCIGACDPDEQIEVVVMLRRQNEGEFTQLMKRSMNGAADAEPVSRDEFDKRFGASAADVAKTEAFAKAHRLSVVRADAGSRSVVLSRHDRPVQHAFGVKLGALRTSCDRRVSRAHGTCERAGRYEGHGDRRAGARQPPAGAPAFPLPAAVPDGAQRIQHLVHAA